VDAGFAFILTTGALTALLLLACVIGFAMVRREQASLRRLAVAHGYRYHGLGEFGAEHTGVSWRCAPRRDDDSGRAWTEFVASGAALVPDAARAAVDAQNGPAWMDARTATLWRQAQGKSSAPLRLSMARHSLTLVREDGLRRATPGQVCALAALGQACVDRVVTQTPPAQHACRA
jgi:hypothetical protein